jgi:hypothetical protein
MDKIDVSKFDMSNFDLNAILRGAQLTLVGGMAGQHGIAGTQILTRNS